MTFDAWLHEQMELHRFNQPKLAEALGVNQSTISNWLRGKSLPDTDNLVALSGLFRYDHLSLMEIVGLINTRGPNVPDGVEQQVVDRLRVLRGEPEHNALVQIFVDMIDIVLAAKDSGNEEDASDGPVEARAGEPSGNHR